jgi:hypothetical protein
MIRLFCFACLAMLLCHTASAEVARYTYKSPDNKRVVRVDRTSEMPDFTVTLKEGNKILWSYHPDPEDKSIRVFWRPDSRSFLMEHVTKNETYRLYIIDIAKDHVELFPVTIPPDLRLLAIVDDSVSWPLPRQAGVFSLTIQDRDSVEHRMQIDREFRLLKVAKDKKAANQALKQTGRANATIEHF